MTWFTENPTPLVVLGILVEAALAVVLMKTGKRPVLWAMLVTAAFTAAAVVANIWIVTPREEVTAALEEMRQLLEQNDRPALIDRIDRGAVSLRNQVQSDQSYLTITRAKLNDLKVTVDPTGTAAKADFIGVIDFKDGGGRLPYNHIVMQFTVQLRKSEGKWFVTDAEYRNVNLGGGGSSAPRTESPIGSNLVG